MTRNLRPEIEKMIQEAGSEGIDSMSLYQEASQLEGHDDRTLLDILTELERERKIYPKYEGTHKHKVYFWGKPWQKNHKKNKQMEMETIVVVVVEIQVVQKIKSKLLLLSKIIIIILIIIIRTSKT